MDKMRTASKSDRGSANFSFKGQRANIFGFAGQEAKLKESKYYTYLTTLNIIISKHGNNS